MGEKCVKVDLAACGYVDDQARLISGDLYWVDNRFMPLFSRQYGMQGRQKAYCPFGLASCSLMAILELRFTRSSSERQTLSIPQAVFRIVRGA
jgi:hypothetical protein